MLGIMALMAVAFVVSALVARPDWAGRIRASSRRYRPDRDWSSSPWSARTCQSTPPSSLPTAPRSASAPSPSIATSRSSTPFPGIVAPGIMTALVIMVAAGPRSDRPRMATTISRAREGLRAGRRPGRQLDLLTGFLRRRLLGDDSQRHRRRDDALRRSRTWRVRQSPNGPHHERIHPGLRGDDHPALPGLARGADRARPGARRCSSPPSSAALIIIMSNQKKLMGNLRNKWWQNLFGRHRTARSARPVGPTQLSSLIGG